MTADPNTPMLHAAYLDDVVMRGGRPMIRSAIFIATAVCEEPVSVFVCYLPADHLIAQAAEMFGSIDEDDEDDADDPPPFRPLRDW